MDFDDFSEEYLTPEVGIVVAATAMLLSPRVRGAVRRGAITGLAGVLAVGDGLAGWARRVARPGEHGDDAAFIRALAQEARVERLK